MSREKKNVITSTVIFVFVFTIFILRLSELQITKGDEYSYFSENLAVDHDYSKATRGLVLSRNLDILARSTELFTFELGNNLDNLGILARYNPNKLGNKVILANLSSRDLNPIITLLKENDIEYVLRKKTVREYEYSEEFSHIIGYTGPADENDISNGYLLDDVVGKYKLEKQYEEYLKGVSGKTILIDGVNYIKQSEPGHNIYLTIDKDWQVSLYNILKKYSEEYSAAGGAGVIVDDSNGDVVAQVSYPGFNNNLFIKGISSSDYQNLLVNRSKPLQDKAIGYAAAPGSTFKLISAYSLLENNIVDTNTTFFSNRCMGLGGGYDFCEFGKFYYGNMNITRAIYKSSNLYFCNYALNDYSQNEFKNLEVAAELFNIGKKTNIDLIGEVSGNMDSPEYKYRTFNDKWFAGDTCNAVIGQGAILATPLQMAMVASAINNNGIYYKPNIVNKIVDVYGNVIVEKDVQILKNIPAKQETWDTIKKGMWDVAHNSEGTVYIFLNDAPGNVRVKTGTAEAYENIEGRNLYRTHGWIIGSFEYLDRNYSFAFHLSYGGGGFYIAQAVRDFINCVYSDFNSCEV